MDSKLDVTNFHWYKWMSIMVTLAGTLGLAGCGGGGGGGATAVTPTPTPTPTPQATLTSIVPSTGATGIALDIKPVITLAISNATSSDATALSFVCSTRKIAFTSAAVLSTDGKTGTITLTPAASSVLAGDSCSITGDVSTSGAGGTVKTTVNTSFSIFSAPVSVAKGLSLIAGTINSPGSKDGALLDASFHRPGAMARDVQGNIYVADGCTANGFDSHALVRKISPSGNVTTFAGSAYYKVGSESDGRRCISGMTIAPDGNLYTYDYHTKVVQRITPLGQVLDVAGAFLQRGTTDGKGVSARFDSWGLTSDPQNNLYLADEGNHTIRRIDASGNVTTLTGVAGVVGSADGTLQNARFSSPSLVKYDTLSNKLFIADMNGIRVIANEVVSTILPMAILNADNCTGAPVSGFDVRSDGSVALTRCQKLSIFKDGALVNRWGSGYSEGDSDGTTATARFSYPSATLFQADGDLLVADTVNNNIKRLSLTNGTVALYAGKRSYWTPSGGQGEAAKIPYLEYPYITKTGEVWFRDRFNNFWGRVDRGGNVQFIAGPTSDARGILKVNDDGSIICEVEVSVNGAVETQITKFDSKGAKMSILATRPGRTPTSSTQTVEAADGTFYFPDADDGIWKLANGSLTKLVVLPAIGGAQVAVVGIAMLPSGDLIVSMLDTRILKISTSGTVTTLIEASYTMEKKDGPVGSVGVGNGPLAVDSKGAIYIANRIGSVIRRIYDGQVSIVAGTWWLDETATGPGAGQIHSPYGLLYDQANNSLVITTFESILRAELP
jgi:hypothetical protein